ncbi:hypothetical protein C8N35_10687 [Breoghania corrubedonensis]|uniref:CheA signal transduction histidine kinase n=1 Tax=Breoghania corrubedonensis TaxID=665038 RepID=A0A2T5V7G8_9HYPH|nr:hypothetical protein [Breoghania corrubedonensis]PTW59704.1 hypothetical protein C8N35_10687 [Breoghania corrubedonensis]
MADYHAVLKRAIDALPENTGAARRAVYQRARQAIVNQLKSYDPPLAPSAITTEQLHLEEAIRKVEADAARASLGLGPAPRAAHTQAPFPTPRQPAAQPPAAQPESEPEAAPATGPGAAQTQDARHQGEPQRPSGHAAPVAAQEKPAATDDGSKAGAKAASGTSAGPGERIEPTPPASEDIFDDPDDDAVSGAGVRLGSDHKDAKSEEAPEPARFEPLSGVRKDAVARERTAAPKGFSSSDTGRGDTAAIPAGAPQGRTAVSDIDALTRGADTPTASTLPPFGERDLRPSRLPMIGLVVLVAVFFIGLASLIYNQRDSILAMFEGSDAPQVAEGPQPASGPASSDDGKDPARLLNDDGSPAAPDARAVTTTRVVPPSEEGVTVAPQGGEPETGVPADDASSSDAAAVPTPAPVPGPTQQPASASQATPVAQRAILYEESADASTGGSAEQGRVLWSTAEETPAGGTKADTVIKAEITIPGRDVSVELTIRPNQDKTLPASHLIELKFNLPPNFSGKGISSVPGLIMKTTEEARGDALRGASVRVADGFFWVALSSIDDERERNIALLRDRGWIDIPILYETGKRAILTLEKGSPGDRVVQTALDAWAKS